MLVTISRSRRGLVPFATPGKDHTAHRLSNCGLGQRGAVLCLYIAGAVFGIIALLLGELPVGPAYVIAGVLLLVVPVAVFLLEGAPYERQQRNALPH